MWKVSYISPCDSSLLRCERHNQSSSWTHTWILIWVQSWDVKDYVSNHIHPLLCITTLFWILLFYYEAYFNDVKTCQVRLTLRLRNINRHRKDPTKDTGHINMKHMIKNVGFMIKDIQPTYPWTANCLNSESKCAMERYFNYAARRCS